MIAAIDIVSLIAIAVCGIALIYCAVKGMETDKSVPYKRLPWPRPDSLVVLCGDEKKEAPKKVETPEEKKKRLEAARAAKSPANLLKRAQARITQEIEDQDRKTGPQRLCCLTVLYGRDDSDEADLRVFAEFADKAVGIYYANADPDNDAWVFFEPEGIQDLFTIIERQKNR